MLKVIVDLKWPMSKYARSYAKTFNDERHMDNWVAMMERKGAKHIGSEPDNDAAKELFKKYQTNAQQ
jgi:hypothetical protein